VVLLPALFPSTFQKHPVKEISSQHQENPIAKYVPGGQGIPLSTGGEATAVNIKAAGQIKQQRNEESRKQQVRQNDRALNPQAQNQQAPENKLQPGQDNRSDIDEGVGQDFIIVNHPGKRSRVKDFIDTGGNENHPYQQPHPKQQRPLKKQLAAALPFHDVRITGWFIRAGTIAMGLDSAIPGVMMVVPMARILTCMILSTRAWFFVCDFQHFSFAFSLIVAKTTRETQTEAP
jgi:hypothetical protein